MKDCASQNFTEDCKPGIRRLDAKEAQTASWGMADPQSQDYFAASPFFHVRLGALVISPFLIAAAETRM